MVKAESFSAAFQTISKLARTHPSDFKVKVVNDHAAGQLNRTTPYFNAVLTNYHAERADRSEVDDPSEISQRAKSGKGLKIKPVPYLLQAAMNKADAMLAGRQVGFAPMPNGLMGYFLWFKGKANGTIRLLDDFRVLVRIIGSRLAYLALVHEAAHALAREWGELSEFKVLDGEVFAFYIQYLAQEYFDEQESQGWNVALLIDQVEDAIKRYPKNKLLPIALRYLKTVHMVRMTRGDMGKIRRDVVESLPYKEGEPHKHSDGHSPEPEKPAQTTAPGAGAQI